jgi:hypothetical protein
MPVFAFGQHQRESAIDRRRGCELRSRQRAVGRSIRLKDSEADSWFCGESLMMTRPGTSRARGVLISTFVRSLPETTVIGIEVTPIVVFRFQVVVAGENCREFECAVRPRRDEQHVTGAVWD